MGAAERASERGKSDGWLIRAVLLVATSLTCLFPAEAEEWPAWRGPRGDGTSTEPHVPVKWGADDNIAWKVPIPGKGHSSPIVWGDWVFLTTCREGERQRVLLALDRRTGETRWERVVLTARLEKKHRLNSYASSTPATDGRLVWVTFLDFPRIQVVCYKVDGEEVWRESPGEFYSVHGYCSSLIPYKDTIILNADQDAKLPKRAYIVAFEKGSGKESWRIDRTDRIRSYCPPFIVEAGGRTQMLISGAKHVRSYNPDTGEQYWFVQGPTEQFAANLVYTDGMFMMTGGWPSLHILGIRPDGEGNVTKSHVVWHLREGASYVPSPIAAGKHFFLVADNGSASCLEARTGKRPWREQLGRHHSASPVSANGNLYFIDDAGVTHVLKAAPSFEVVARNALGEPCRASPAIARGQIFIRGTKHLYCIGRAR
jgi:outer membrane protein assembly factor BamB